VSTAVGVRGEPELFPDGVDVGDDHVIGSGLIDIKNNGQGDQTHEEVRHIAPSIGQLAGVDPVTGDEIVDNENLLTLKPKLMDLENHPENRVFVIAADQLVGGDNVIIDYSGDSVVISVANGSITTTQLDLNSVDTRYVLKSGDTVSGNMSLAGNDLVQVGEIVLADGTHGLTTRGCVECRFIGNGAGQGNAGICVNAIGGSAAAGNVGWYVDALGGGAAADNSGHAVVAIGCAAAWWNLASCVNAVGMYAGSSASGQDLNAIGSWAGMGCSGCNVSAIGCNAGENNTGDDCFFAGESTGKDNIADNVIAIGENISGPGLAANSCYLDGDLRLNDCNGKGGGTALHFANGTTISTTAETINLNGAKLANVTIDPPMGDIGMGEYTAGQ